MIMTEFHIPPSATSSAAASTLAIFVYLVIIVNIYPEDALRQSYVSKCYAQFLSLQAMETRQGPPAGNISSAARQSFDACMAGVPAESLPSVSEAVDHWRGVSAVVMAIPTGAPPPRSLLPRGSARPRPRCPGAARANPSSTTPTRDSASTTGSGPASGLRRPEAGPPPAYRSADGGS